MQTEKNGIISSSKKSYNSPVHHCTGEKKLRVKKLDNVELDVHNIGNMDLLTNTSRIERKEDIESPSLIDWQNIDTDSG